MADLLPSAAWTASPDLRRTWFNRSSLEWIGRPLDPELVCDWLENIHVDDRERCARVFAESARTGCPFEIEYRLRHALGDHRAVRERGSPHFDHDGRLEGFVGGFSEIADFAATSGSASETEARFQTLVDHSPAIMWITDEKASCTYLSRRWFEITGRTPEQDLGFGWVENVHPDDRAEAANAFFKNVEARGRISIRYRLRHKDGRYRWALDSGVPVHDANGVFTGYIGTVIDVHDQIATQQELTTLQERFQRSAEATDLGVWYCDLPFDVLVWNKEVKRHFFMASDAHVTIQSFYEHIHPDDREETRASIARSIEERTPYDILYRTIDPKNPSSQNWIRAIGWTDRDNSGKPIRFDGITLNVTCERERELELKRAKEEAERANELKSTFLANVSHEIRTPLGAILGFADLLRDPRVSDEERESFHAIIARNGDQLSTLIGDILELSKIEAGHFKVSVAPVQTRALLEQAAVSLAPKARDRGVELRYDVAPSTPEVIGSDSVRLLQILANIVGNAIKFTEAGSVTVSARRGLEADDVVFEVRDTGIGIQDHQRSNLFKPFSQADLSITRRYGGTGLGLILSRKFAQALGGDVTLKSSVLGQGSVFEIRIRDLPHEATREEATQTEAVAPRSDASPSDPSTGRLAGLNVLVVDDSADNRRLIARVLTTKGARLSEAANGLEAIEAVRARAPDVVLIDLQMPELDGYAATERIRKNGFTGAIIALSAHAMAEVRENTLKAGCDDFLSKPIDFQRLVETIAVHAATG